MMNEIVDRTEKVFDDIYTVEDILKGDTIEMYAEARKIAIEQLKKESEEK